MERFTELTTVAAPMPQDNVDTDIIYPARFLLITDRDGLERYGFHDWRFDAAGAEKPDFILARAPWHDAHILVTGINFGCGSSREHAPWALLDMGIRCVIAPSFGEIFYNNCFKNGILPIVANPADHARIMAEAEAARPITVDLVAQDIRCAEGPPIPFEVEPRRRAALINGWDEIAMIAADHGGDIDRFETAQQQSQPWLWRRDTLKKEETYG